MRSLSSCLFMVACFAAVFSIPSMASSLDSSDWRMTTSSNLDIDPALLIETNSGPIVGTYTNEAGLLARAFMGIPYAAPPNGTLRFQAPVPPTAWTEPRDATIAGPGCQQVCSLPPGSCPPVQSEDCLFLNVFVPNVIDTGLLPVMVFIHGGNFRQGSGTSPMYDGTVMVNTSNVILVTMNYRLGALGFFFSDSSTANNGLMDQQLAMIWVQNNIFNFGGDNSKVTLFGQSAGGTSVGSHLQNPTSTKLFQRAIIESIPLGIPIRFPDEATALNAIFAKDLNCAVNDLACLQSADIADILAATHTAASQIGPDWKHVLEIAQPWQPAIDMPSFPIATEISAFFQNYPGTIPLMMGTTSEEAYLFIYEAVNKSMSIVAAGALETAIFGLSSLPSLDKYYPLPLLGDERDPVSRLASDALFICAARNASNGIQASASATPVYMYVFDHVSQNSAAGWGPNYTMCWDRVCHGSELPYVFNTAAASGQAFTPSEQLLSNAITRYWTNFATTGNPNQGKSVSTQWPQFGAQRNIITFATEGLTISQNYHGEACDYMDTLGYLR